MLKSHRILNLLISCDRLWGRRVSVRQHESSKISPAQQPGFIIAITANG